MATQIIENLSDDLDPRVKSNVETVTMFDPRTGRKLEIELGEANRKHLEGHFEKLDKYIAVAREVEISKSVKPAKAGAKSDVDKIRVWARANGYDVGGRGRIKGDILAAYASAQEAIAKPDTDAQASGDEPVTPALESAIANSEAGNVTDLGDFTQYVDTDAQAEVDSLLDEVTGNGEPVSEDDVLKMLAKMDADGEEITEENLKAALASE